MADKYVELSDYKGREKRMYFRRKNDPCLNCANENMILENHRALYGFNGVIGLIAKFNSMSKQMKLILVVQGVIFTQLTAIMITKIL